MKYEVIARRYRPRQFEEVVGQESIAQTLRGGILQERMAHAYLFAGPRGVGKTSMARIFSKAINCPKALDRSRPEKEWARPCDKCTVCDAVHTGQDIDVIELDGASHRGIEDIRAIIEGVNRPASRGHYKVYLIDEVHMLTREAFNALLKTLEEPPAHVKFIFATTEAHKIPDTVLSRCQRFDFQPIREGDTVKRLKQICKAEKRKVSGDLLGKIARYSRGGMRDSQTLLDQLMTYCDGDLTEDGLDRLTGRVSTPELEGILAGLVAGDAGGVLSAVRACLQAGADPLVLVEQVIEQLHGELVRVLTEGGGADASKEDSPADPVDKMIGCLQILLSTASQLKSSAYPDVAVEVALVKLARLEDPRSLDKALDQLTKMEHKIGQVSAGPGGSAGNAAPAPGQSSSRPASPGGGGASSSQPGAQASREAQPESAVAVAEPPSQEPVQAESETSFSELAACWDQLIAGMKEKSLSMAEFLRDARLEESDAPGEFLILVHDELSFRQLQKPHRIDAIVEGARLLTGADWKIRIRIAELAEQDEGPAEEPEAEETTREETGPEEPAVQEAAANEPAANKPSANKPAADKPAAESGSANGAGDDSDVDKTLKIFKGRVV